MRILRSQIVFSMRLTICTIYFHVYAISILCSYRVWFGLFSVDNTTLLKLNFTSIMPRGINVTRCESVLQDIDHKLDMYI